MAGEDEGDEARSEVGSPGHERRWRDDVGVVKNGGNLSSSRERRRARESSGVRGKGVESSGVLLVFYRGSGSTGEGWSGQ
jgi:hypothetical protein